MTDNQKPVEVVQADPHCPHEEYVKEGWYGWICAECGEPRPDDWDLADDAYLAELRS